MENCGRMCRDGGSGATQSLSPVDHGHRLAHSETFGWSVLERDLSGGLIDFPDLTEDRRALGGSSAEHQKRGQKRCPYCPHEFGHFFSSNLSLIHFTVTWPVIPYSRWLGIRHEYSNLPSFVN